MRPPWPAMEDWVLLRKAPGGRVCTGRETPEQSQAMARASHGGLSGPELPLPPGLFVLRSSVPSLLCRCP